MEEFCILRFGYTSDEDSRLILPRFSKEESPPPRLLKFAELSSPLIGFLFGLRSSDIFTEPPFSFGL